MKLFTTLLIALIAAEHVWIMILEMFLWTHRIGRKTFGMTAEVAESSKVLAANQGLYNGFLAAGLVWSLLTDQLQVEVFFVCCVLVAGIYGGLTAKRSILYVQALPALIGLLMLYASRYLLA
jgi:putative membrane protein